jgi:geranylgeranyl pyrophosphate synthase
VSALAELAEQLRGEDTPIAPHVVESPESTSDWSLVMEAVREGYLLHYGESRILADYDQDLALLAGDYLYALGLDRLAAQGNTEAVAVLSELIARCAQFHAEGRGDELDPLWDEAARRIGAIS